MRSVIILAISLVVIGGVFVAYLLMQGSHASIAARAGGKGTDTTPRHPVATSPVNPDLPVNDVYNGSFESYDKVTGALASRFHATKYDPKADGTIDTDRPQAEFFLDNGQVLRIRGTTGEIVMPPSSSGGSNGGSKMGGRTQMPTRGLLHNVTLELFATTDESKKPGMVCTMNNASFDNETFSVATEAFDDPKTGKHIDADQVPVTVRGDADGPFPYDFDGRGMSLQWDERDRKLQVLDIAHGKELTIKHPKAMHIGAATTKPTTLSPMKTTALLTPSPLDFGGAGSSVELKGDSFTRSLFPGYRGEGINALLASADPASSIREVLQATPQPAPAPRRTRRRRPASRPVTLPSTGPTSGPTTKPKTLEPYRAVFTDNVRVFQGVEPVAVCDQMNVDFDLVGKPKEHSSEPNATASAGPKEHSAPDDRASKNSPAKKRDTKVATLPVTPLEPTTHAATTQPDEQPVKVLWTGTLHVAPLDSDEPDPPEDANDTVVEMIGMRKPVDVDWQNSRIHCASFRYHSADDTASVRNSAMVPIIEMIDARGTHIHAPGLQFSGVQRIAEIPGPAYLEFPVEQTQKASSTTKPATNATAKPSTNPTTAPTSQPARIDWLDVCVLQMTDGPREQMTLQHAEFDGDVRVAHPEMELQSQVLQVDFQPSEKSTSSSSSTKPSRAKGSTSQPSAPNVTIRQLVATQSVHSAIRDTSKPANAPPQTIDCEQLMVAFDTTDANTTYPKIITADGSVIAGNGESQLEAAHLDALMEPSTQPAAEGSSSTGANVTLQSLFAHTNVRGQTTDGRMLEAQQLEVSTRADGTAAYKLLGPPDAKLGTGTTTLTGPIITFEPATGLADVAGAGTMHAIQQSRGKSATQPAATQPIDVTWTDHLHADGKANRIDIIGGVVANSLMSDGSHNTVTGATMTMTLADAATTRPTTQGATALPTTKPAVKHATNSNNIFGGGSGSNDAFKDKVVQLITIDDATNVEVQSMLTNLAGDVIRRLNLYAKLLQYDPIAKKLTIPVKGQMLFQDNRIALAAAAATQPSSQSSTQPMIPTAQAKQHIEAAIKPATQPGSKALNTPAGMVGDMRGATAFQWTDQLIYDDANHVVTMLGNVVVVHKSAPGAADGYRLNADRLDATMDAGEDKSTTKPSTTPATKPTSKPNDDATIGGAKLKHLVADGHVVFLAQRLHFEAMRIEFDPQHNILTAYGLPGAPATLFDENGLSSGSFEKLVYDTKTDKMKMTNFRAAIRK